MQKCTIVRAGARTGSGLRTGEHRERRGVTSPGGRAIAACVFREELAASCRRLVRREGLVSLQGVVVVFCIDMRCIPLAYGTFRRRTPPPGVRVSHAPPAVGR